MGQIHKNLAVDTSSSSSPTGTQADLAVKKTVSSPACPGFSVPMNIVAYLGHTGRMDGAQVSASDYEKFQVEDLPQEVEAISCRIRQ
jgi:hypothetical protein